MNLSASPPGHPNGSCDECNAREGRYRLVFGLNEPRAVYLCLACLYRLEALVRDGALALDGKEGR